MGKVTQMFQLIDIKLTKFLKGLYYSVLFDETIYVALILTSDLSSISSNFFSFSGSVWTFEKNEII